MYALIVNNTSFTHTNKYIFKCMSVLSSSKARYTTVFTANLCDHKRSRSSEVEIETELGVGKTEQDENSKIKQTEQGKNESSKSETKQEENKVNCQTIEHVG